MRLRSSAIAVLVLLAPGPGRAAASPKCDGVLDSLDGLPKDPARSDSLQMACRAGMTCTSACAKDDRRHTALGSFDGGFLCAGKRERIVSLFPCADAPGTHASAGTVILLQATTRGWRPVARLNGTVLSGASCSVHGAGTRDILVCKTAWGPSQGIVGTTLCVAWAHDGVLAQSCPLRVTSSRGEVAELGAVRVEPGRGGRTSIGVDVGRRRLRVEMDEKGVRASESTRLELEKDPIPGVELRED